MILTDSDIERELAEGALQIDPLDNPDLQIQPASVDLRLGGSFLIQNPSYKYLSIDGEHGPPEQGLQDEMFAIERDEHFDLLPGKFALAETFERICIPPHLCAQVEGRSSVGRLGVMIHITAGYIDPGFEGKITLELYNAGGVTVRLPIKHRICQLVLHATQSKARRPYGSRPESKYQNQNGVTASKKEILSVRSSD